MAVNDNGGNGHAPDAQPQAMQFDPSQGLIIFLTPEGSIGVNGAIHNKIFAYGLLEGAKDAIRAFHEKNESRVQLVPAAAMPPAPKIRP